MTAKNPDNTSIIKGWYFKNLSREQIASRIIFYIMILSALVVGSLCVKNAVEWVDKPFPGFLLNQRIIVGYIGQYHWTGTQAGLRYPDKILKVNDQAISSTKELEGIILHTKIGDPVKYQVVRDNKVLEVAIPTMRFTQFDLLMTFGILFLMGTLYLLIGIVVFVLKPDTAVSWVFFLGCFLQGISSFVSFDIETTHYGFIRAYFFNEAFLPAVVLHLSMLFPEKAGFLEKHPRMQIIPYIISAVLFFPLELLYPRPFFARVYEIVLFYTIIGVMALIASLLYAYLKKSSVLARQRAKVVLVGAVLALPLPATAPFLAFLGETLGKIKIATNFSSIPTIIFPASIAYAIAKHNLFDVDVYIKRAVGYGFMTALVGATYISIQMIIRPAVLHPMFGEFSENIHPILFAILVVFFFNPINQRVQKVVDKLFYREKINYKETVISVSNALTSVLNLTEVVKRIISTVRKEMFIDTAGVILLEPLKKECQTFFIGDSSDKGKDDLKDVCIPYDDPLISLLSNEKKLITAYDVSEDPQYRGVKESCGKRFSEMGASIVVPFIYQNEVKGALVLGYKKSGHFYTKEDIDLLSTLASHGAVAIENARLAEQMKKQETVRTNLARYLSPQIVDQIITNDVQVNLGGDRKVVTILFSDIRNYTTITETRQPDQLVQILNEYFTEMASIIFENQGSLDKYIGDAIIAVFGSLITLENSANNAVNASIQMMKQMSVTNEKWMNKYGFSMDIGIGINTGKVFLGNIGSPERMEFTVIGDTVNIASRFSELAKPGQILITRETLDFMGNDVTHRELPPTPVKGKTGKLEVYEITYA